MLSHGIQSAPRRRQSPGQIATWDKTPEPDVRTKPGPPQHLLRLLRPEAPVRRKVTGREAHSIGKPVPPARAIQCQSDESPPRAQNPAHLTQNGGGMQHVLQYSRTDNRVDRGGRNRIEPLGVVDAKAKMAAVLGDF